MEDILKNYMEYKKPRARVKYLKTAITYIFKTLDDYFLGMDDKQREREALKMVKDLKAKRYEVVLVQKY